jgi:stage II sporulation protein D
VPIRLPSRRAAALLPALTLALLAPSVASSGAPAGGPAALVIRGHGFGHGIGLSQWGAEQRAAAGWSYPQILGFYYPGTTLGSAAPRQVRVLLAEQPRVQVGSDAPFTVRDARGSVVRLGAGLYALDADGRLGAEPLRLPAVALPGSAPLRLGGTAYSGTLGLSTAGAHVRVVNTLELEDYLVGVVSSECPGSWPGDALRAQAVASRSFALASLRPQADFDLYPDDRSQNYHGLQKRLPGAAAAVSATRGRVLLYRGAVVPALFSAANGGLTSVPDGIWTSEATPPYFAARPDTFDAKSPNTNWGPLTISLSAVSQAFPQLPSAVTSVSLAVNAGRRVTAVTFAGADGTTVSVGGYAFQQRFGLRSTYFAISAEG